MTCKDFEQLIVQLVYDELNGEQKEDTLKHIASCSSCQETYNDLKESSDILTDSFSKLDELKLTDEELVAILKVDAGAVSTTDQDDSDQALVKQPIYLTPTFGIAASLLLSCAVLMMVYWSKITGQAVSEMAKAEQMNAEPSAKPTSSTWFKRDINTLNVELEEVDEATIDIPVDEYVGAKAKRRRQLPAPSTRPVDVSDDGPATDDNLSVTKDYDYKIVDKSGRLDLTNGKTITFSYEDTIGKNLPAKPNLAVSGNRIVTPGNSNGPLPEELSRLQNGLDIKGSAEKESIAGEEKKGLDSGSQTKAEYRWKSVRDSESFKSTTKKKFKESRVVEEVAKKPSLPKGGQTSSERERSSRKLQAQQLICEAKDQLARAEKGDKIANYNEAAKNIGQALAYDPSLSKEADQLLSVIRENVDPNVHANSDEDPFVNDLVANTKPGKEKALDGDEVNLPHFVDEKTETVRTEEETQKAEPVRESFFKTIPVNPFVMTANDALSTFALDTDTASYTIARNYINQGYLPPAGSVRTEEFVNAFDYNYPGKVGDTFTVHAEAAPSPFGNGLVMLKVGVRGKVIGRDGRKPSNLVFAIDTSGSMERRDRMPLLKKGLNALLDNLSSKDRISLVTYGRESQLMLDNAPMSDVDSIRRTINDLQCGGSTNLNQGVQMAYQIAQKNFRSGAVNSIILCSDGMANIGAQTANSMIQSAATYRKHGISFNSVGFGMGNYNDDILETMANKGDGSYVFIDSAKTSVDFFTNELGNRLNVIAKDAKIQVKFDPRRVRRYRLLGYENRDIADKDFRNDAIDAGEVGSGQSATALYEVELIDNSDIRDLGTVYIRYKNPDTDTVEEINSRLRGDIVQNRSVKDSPRFFLAAAVSEFAEILRNSEYAQGSSVTDVQRLAEQIAIQLPLDGKAAEFLQLVKMSNGLPRGK